jgi:hypothetical protein
MKQQKVLEVLNRQGWYFGQNISDEERCAMMNEMGQVIWTTEVTPNPKSRAMVTSRKAIGPHTDHHRAEYILWHCIEQSTVGGESLLIDAREILNGMSPEDLRELEQVSLMEHKVFQSDGDSYPMLERGEDGQYKIYYSFWLASNEATPAFQRFSAKVKSTPPIVVNLQPNDVLVIDNRRMLHARGPISDDSRRHLRRYWIEKKIF